MRKKDPRVDAYIAHAAAFARPILVHLRELVHRACPEVSETIKWNFPHFEFEGILCSMASFKAHCAFGFWKGSLMGDAGGTLETEERTAMGHMGRITSLSDLPSDREMIRLIKKAAKLNKGSVKAPLKPKTAKKRLAVPAYFMAALKKNKKALATYEKFSDSNRREYVEWVIEAKSDETRLRRLATAVEWMVEGKVRNWKYIKK